MSFTKKDYRRHLQSPYWKAVRRAALKRADGECEHCGVERQDHHLEVHHKHYGTFGDERLSDVIVLCVSCHDSRHPGHPERDGTRRLKRRRVKAKDRDRRVGCPHCATLFSSHYAIKDHRISKHLDEIVFACAMDTGLHPEQAMEVARRVMGEVAY